MSLKQRGDFSQQPQLGIDYMDDEQSALPIDNPGFIINAKNDNIAADETSLRRYFINSEVCMLDDGGHMLPLTAAQAINDLIKHYFVLT